jgi:hypothetical protein
MARERVLVVKDEIKHETFSEMSEKLSPGALDPLLDGLKTVFPPQDFCVGLRKVGPSLYRVVQLTVTGDKVTERSIDYLDQPLEHAAKTMLLCLKGLMGKMP